MKKKIKYTDEPLGKLRVVRDFLPPPEQLAFREEGVKVTIRKLVDEYAIRHQTP